MVVHDDDASWNPESGQLLLDFEVAELAAHAAPVARRLAREARRAPEPLTAEDWYDLGVDLEAASPADARDAYQRAIALDRQHVAACVNLGRLLQEAGRPAGAAAQYRAALAAEPSNPTAAFNLGTAMEDLSRPPPPSRRIAGPSPRTRPLPTRTSTWRDCTRRAASGRRRCGT